MGGYSRGHGRENSRERGGRRRTGHVRGLLARARVLDHLVRVQHLKTAQAVSGSSGEWLKRSVARAASGSSGQWLKRPTAKAVNKNISEWFTQAPAPRGENQAGLPRGGKGPGRRRARGCARSFGSANQSPPRPGRRGSPRCPAIGALFEPRARPPPSLLLPLPVALPYNRKRSVARATPRCVAWPGGAFGDLECSEGGQLAGAGARQQSR